MENRLVKNQKIIGECRDYTFDGKGIVSYQNQIVFVPQLMIGEKAKIHIIKVLKKYSIGKIIEILTTNNNRQKPHCTLFGQCGGCHLLHMNTESEQQFKINHVKQLFRKLAKKEIEIDQYIEGNSLHYRCKAQIPIQNDKMGFYRLHSNSIVDMNYCNIQSEKINEIYQWIKSKIFFYNQTNNFRHLLIKHGHFTNEIMVVFICYQKEKQLSELADLIYQQFSEVKSVILNINQRKDNVILGDQEIVLKGSEFIYEKINGISYQIASRSFFQVNPIQMIKLYDQVVKYGDFTKNDKVLDLYCGVGSIALYVAKYVEKVVGIEIVEAAIDNANQNKIKNKINNVEFFVNDAATFVKKNKNEYFDVIIVDPPRKGLDEETIKTMTTMNPKKIVYVSCDPATLARDVAIFEQLGYQMLKISLCELFKGSYHIESVIILSKINKI